MDHDSLVIKDAVRSIQQANVLELLIKIISNILLNPLNAKFRSIKRENKLFATRILPCAPATQIISAIGFAGHIVLELEDSLLNMALLQTTKDLLVSKLNSLSATTSTKTSIYDTVVTSVAPHHNSKPPPGPSATEKKVLELKKKEASILSKAKNVVDRNISVIFPNTSATTPITTVVADSTSSSEDSKLLATNQKSRMTVAQKKLQFSTKNQRDLDALSRHRVFTSTLLRFTFANRLVVQATFGPTETIADVYKFLESEILVPQVQFYLFTTPPRVVLSATSSATLVASQMVPAAKIHVGVKNDVAEFLLPRFLETSDAKKTTSSSTDAHVAYPHSTPLVEEKQRLVSSSAKAPGKKPAWLKI